MYLVESAIAFIIATLCACALLALVHDSERKPGLCLKMAGGFSSIGVFLGVRHFVIWYYVVRSSNLYPYEWESTLFLGAALGSFFSWLIYRKKGEEGSFPATGVRMEYNRMPICLSLSFVLPVVLTYSFLPRITFSGSSLDDIGIGGAFIIIGILLCSYIVGFIMIVASLIRRERYRTCAYISLALYLLATIVVFVLALFPWVLLHRSG